MQVGESGKDLAHDRRGQGLGQRAVASPGRQRPLERARGAVLEHEGEVAAGGKGRRAPDDVSMAEGAQQTHFPGEGRGGAGRGERQALDGDDGAREGVDGAEDLVGVTKIKKRKSQPVFFLFASSSLEVGEGIACRKHAKWLAYRLFVLLSLTLGSTKRLVSSLWKQFGIKKTHFRRFAQRLVNRSRRFAHRERANSFSAANVENRLVFFSLFQTHLPNTHLTTGPSSELLLQQVPVGSDGASSEESGGRGGLFQAPPGGRHELMLEEELARRRHWLLSGVLHLSSWIFLKTERACAFSFLADSLNKTEAEETEPRPQPQAEEKSNAITGNEPLCCTSEEKEKK